MVRPVGGIAERDGVMHRIDILARAACQGLLLPLRLESPNIRDNRRRRSYAPGFIFTTLAGRLRSLRLTRRHPATSRPRTGALAPSPRRPRQAILTAAGCRVDVGAPPISCRCSRRPRKCQRACDLLLAQHNIDITDQLSDGGQGTERLRSLPRPIPPTLAGSACRSLSGLGAARSAVHQKSRAAEYLNGPAAPIRPPAGGLRALCRSTGYIPGLVGQTAACRPPQAN